MRYRRNDFRQAWLAFIDASDRRVANGNWIDWPRRVRPYVSGVGGPEFEPQMDLELWRRPGLAADGRGGIFASGPAQQLLTVLAALGSFLGRPTGGHPRFAQQARPFAAREHLPTTTLPCCEPTVGGGGPATDLEWVSLHRGYLWNNEESFRNYPQPLGQDWFLDLLGDGARADGYKERRATPD